MIEFKQGDDVLTLPMKQIIVREKCADEIANY